MAKPKLTYLDVKGFGEGIRLTLYVGKIDFIDHRVSYEGVKELNDQGKLPYGQVPILEVDGEIFSQSVAILRWAGRRAGLYPTETMQQLRCDSIEEALTDIKKLFPPVWYGSILGRNPITKGPMVPIPEPMRDEVLKGLNETVLPARFAQLERALKKSGGPYFCGEDMMSCDISFYVMGSGLLSDNYAEGVKASVLDDCPLLTALIERVDNHPRVKEWNEAHDHQPLPKKRKT
ncbi:Glutathione S-transferase 1 (GST class-sigma) [Durusdinium trenchii]|uniref:Glutathione S-transferase 1 (GST class-sigma) n=1 Tax=Durusdinium trenchii TaxID=1381693 RepID=A0ABP0L0I4_9DINO